MKNSLLTSALLLVIALLQGGNAKAQIISDDFTGTGNLTGTRPDLADLPGGTYVSANTSTHGSVIYSNNTAELVTNAAAEISIASAGGYVKPTTFTISAQIKMGTISLDNSNSNIRGIGLGFFSGALPEDTLGRFSENSSTFAGVVLEPNGTLALYTPTAHTPSTSLTFAYNATELGAFSANTFYTLSYRVDTTTGGISDLTLSDALGAENAAFNTNVFTNDQTANAAFYSNTAVAGNGFVDNFLVAPEPSTYALLLGGVAVLFFMRKWRSSVLL